jgi:hypothetical protein
MLQSQLRGAAAEWAWDPRAHQFAEMDYDQFKEALKKSKLGRVESNHRHVNTLLRL